MVSRNHLVNFLNIEDESDIQPPHLIWQINTIRLIASETLHSYQVISASFSHLSCTCKQNQQPTRNSFGLFGVTEATYFPTELTTRNRKTMIRKTSRTWNKLLIKENIDKTLVTISQTVSI